MKKNAIAPVVMKLDAKMFCHEKNAVASSMGVLLTGSWGCLPAGGVRRVPRLALACGQRSARLVL